MINLEEIFKFKLAEHGKAMLLTSDKPRIVRLEVNTSAPTMFSVQRGEMHPSGGFVTSREADGDPQFLAVVEGREYLTFKVHGPVAIWQTGEGECWWWCAENEATTFVRESAETFTKIIEKRPRDHNLERVTRKLMEAQQRENAAMRAQFTSSVSEAVAAALKAAESKPNDEPDDKAVAKPKGGRKPAKPVSDDPPAPDDDGGGEGDN